MRTISNVFFLKFNFIQAVLLIALLTSCETESSETSDGDWRRYSYFEGSNRANAAAFSIGDKAYIMGGYTGDTYMRDFWEYVPDGEYWVRKEDFPGKERSHAVAFSINGKGYVGTGYDGTNRLKDFWEFDPATDAWKELAPFGGTARYSAVGFGLMGKGYIGTGFDGSDQKDIWQYDPATDSWQQAISMGGAKRSGAVAFVINDVAYITTGINNGTFEFDVWALDGQTLTWSRKNDLDEDDSYNIIRNEAVAFTLGNFAYITTGQQGSILGTTWEYRPESDTWHEKTSFEGTYRTGASAITVNGRGFVLLGRSSNLRFDDIWEFMPFEAYDESF